MRPEEPSLAAVLRAGLAQMLLLADAIGEDMVAIDLTNALATPDGEQRRHAGVRRA